MDKRIKQYEALVNNAVEISQAMLDMEGGRYLLSIFSELVHDMLDEGNISGAETVVRKLYETVDVPFPGQHTEDTSAWTELFIGEIEDVSED